LSASGEGKLPRPPHLGDLAKQERAQVELADASGQAVAARLDSERGAPGHQDVDGIVIHQRLELRRPRVQVLDLIQEYVGRVAGPSGLVERFPQNPILEPAAERQDRRLQSLQGRQLVELDAQEPAGFDAFVEVGLDELLLDRRLPHLPRPPENHDGRQSGLQALPGRFERPAVERGQDAAWPAGPPRVRRVDELGERRRQALEVEDVAPGHRTAILAEPITRTGDPRGP
jgi:hypothetical protein